MRNLWLLFLVGLATGFISEKLYVSSQTPFSTTDDLYIEGHTSGGLPIDDEDGDDNDGSGSGSGDYAFRADKEEELMRFLNFSQTTVSKKMVPTQPQPTANSPHNPSTTATHSQDPSTTVKDTETTPFVLPNGDNHDEEVAGPTADWVTQRTSPSPTSTPQSETTATKFSMDITVNKDTNEDNSLDRWDVSTPKNRGDEDKVIQELDNELMANSGRGSRIYEMDSPEEVTSENMWERTEVLAAVIACGVVGFLCAVFLLALLAYRMKKKDEGSYDLGDTKVSTTAYQKAPTKEFYA
ncbi:syndecan-2-like [Epinephelus fuscoguttatus]|uniref:syndecan-2-like n=1 Tax=Epinephelus fuscoguttatus TaxID=293821 RepID=UPI0020D10558|nr:syndecan-2-like [Epinephelus fuscoguttatus]